MASSSDIIVSHVTKEFGPVRAVDDLSFTVRSGRVTGFLGPNGSGKTTTLRILLGLVRASSGEATFAGTRYADLTHPHPRGSVARGDEFPPRAFRAEPFALVCASCPG